MALVVSVLRVLERMSESCHHRAGSEKDALP
jgi:hypothetical protein